MTKRNFGDAGHIEYLRDMAPRDTVAVTSLENTNAAAESLFHIDNIVTLVGTIERAGGIARVEWSTFDDGSLLLAIHSNAGRDVAHAAFRRAMLVHQFEVAAHHEPVNWRVDGHLRARIAPKGYADELEALTAAARRVLGRMSGCAEPNCSACRSNRDVVAELVTIAQKSTRARFVAEMLLPPAPQSSRLTTHKCRACGEECTCDINAPYGGCLTCGRQKCLSSGALIKHACESCGRPCRCPEYTPADGCMTCGRDDCPAMMPTPKGATRSSNDRMLRDGIAAEVVAKHTRAE